MKNTTLMVVMPRISERDRRLGGTHPSSKSNGMPPPASFLLRLHSDPEDVIDMFLRNVGLFPKYTTAVTALISSHY
jgi:hypothetical protein